MPFCKTVVLDRNKIHSSNQYSTNIDIKLFSLSYSICVNYWISLQMILFIKGLFERNQDCIIDVRVTDTDAPSYRTRNPYSVIKSQEAEKKKKYLRLCLEQRRIFVPFVVSVDGLIGKEGRSPLLKQLSLPLAEKWKKPQSVVAGIVLSRMIFAILWATNYCIWGSRTPFHKVSREIQWDGGSGIVLYEISD